MWLVSIIYIYIYIDRSQETPTINPNDQLMSHPLVLSRSSFHHHNVNILSHFILSVFN